MCSGLCWYLGGANFDADEDGICDDYIGTVSDIDVNIYQTIQIGNQIWMAENLKVINYKDGSGIPNVTNNDDWIGLSTDAYSDYNNNSTKSETYGRLYNGFAVNDSRGLCMEGWHVPTYAEWNILNDYLGGSSVSGGKMKEAGTEHWNSPNAGATNESGFTALSFEYRQSEGGGFPRPFG